ncbi:MAG: DUF3102 domain-containing protein [Methylobacterium sp.]|uniref:DUF3102 domain-containing protein n=1 Tax=Methylobacterium sp. TaxID=409 RepID=UPI0025EF1399|nr:DUF3102 domain-containing protein [Methylobacterium sp.]MBX9930143.1 DUF3102 domain-containing protein [Methylobacterium sp.]
MAVIASATPVTSADATFDYGALAPDLAEALRADASRIRSRLRRSVVEALEAGAELARVKALITHGRFGAWLALEFGLSERTAQRLMNAAEAFAGKSDTVSVLEMTAVYSLSAPATPQHVRDGVIAQLETGARPSLEDIKNEVARARKVAAEAKAQVKAEAALSPEARAQKKARAERERKRHHAEHQAYLARNEAEKIAAELAAAIVLERLGPIDTELRDLLMRASSSRFLACLQRAPEDD